MTLPDPLSALLQTREFWARFFFWEREASDEDDEEEREIDDFVVRFHIEPSLGFDLKVSVDGVCSTLFLVHSDLQEPVAIAWDDDAHWHPHVLRWAELDEFCRALADADISFPHPGVSLLLLHRFAPICAGDDASNIVALLEKAWASVQGVLPAEVTRRIQNADHRHDGFRWVETDGEMGLEQDSTEPHIATAYTLRHRDNDDFPRKALGDLFQRVRKRLSASGRPLGLTNYGVPRTALPKRFSLELEIPEPGTDDDAPSPRVVVCALNDALTAAGRGTAISSGTTSRTDPSGKPVWVSWSYHLDVRGDLSASLAVIRRVLADSKASPKTRLELRFPERRSIPLAES